MFNVLSIDGGGIRGVIPAVLLKHIEEKVGKRVADIFDLIVGTLPIRFTPTPTRARMGANRI